MTNIGLGGMRVYSDDANTVGQLLDIDVVAAGEAVTCTVEVAWVRRLTEPAPAKYDVGLRFVAVPAGFLHYVSKLAVKQNAGTLAIIVNPEHRPLAAEALHQLMTDVDDMAAVIVHDGDEGCSCLSAIDPAMPWVRNVSFANADLRRGHAFAINAGLRRALNEESSPSYALLVAPDVVVKTGAVGALVNVLVDQAHVGVVSSQVVDAAGVQQPTVFRFPTFAAALGSERVLHDGTGPVPWVSTVCTMLRLDMLDEIGLFDETLYDGFTAADFCRRAAHAGWQTWLARESSVTAGALEPFGFDHTPSRDRMLFLAAYDRFVSKSYSRVGKWFSVLGYMTGLLIASVVRRARRLQLRDLLRYYRRPRWPAPAEARDGLQE